MPPQQRKPVSSWTKGGAYMGLAFLVPASGWVGHWLGSRLDERWSTSHWATICMMIGLAAGLYETIRQAIRIENLGKNNNQNG